MDVFHLNELCVRVAMSRLGWCTAAINLRPSFADEVVAHARFLVEYLRVQRVACFFTSDDMGQDSFTTLLSALDSVGVCPGGGSGLLSLTLSQVTAVSSPPPSYLSPHIS